MPKKENATKYLTLRGGVYWTSFGHGTALGLRPNGRDKALKVSTGIKAHDTLRAAQLSHALRTLITDKSWHNPARYKEALALHEQAAKIFYSPWKNAVTPQEAIVDFGILSLPLPLSDEEKAEYEKAKNAVAENGRLNVELAEAEATIDSLKKTLGVAMAGSDVELRKVADEYFEWGNLKGGTRGRAWSHDHKRKRRAQLDFWCKKFAKLSQVTLANVEAEQKKLATTLKGKSVNHYTETISALCEFARTRKYLITNPLADLERMFDDSDEKKWRPLTETEVFALLRSCKAERRIIYEVALCTGARRSELDAFTVGDLDEERGGVMIQSETAKNRIKAFKVLPPWLLKKLVKLSANKLPTASLLSMNHDPHAAFVADWEKTKLPRHVDGTVACLHSLRKTYLTKGEQSNASPKTVQAMACHLTPNMAMKRYVGVTDSELVRVTNVIGDWVKRA